MNRGNWAGVQDLHLVQEWSLTVDLGLRADVRREGSGSLTQIDPGESCAGFGCLGRLNVV